MISMVGCEGDLATVKGIRPPTKTTHWFDVGPMTDPSPEAVEVFLPALLGDVEIVLDSSYACVDLWGIGASRVGHWCDSEAI